MNLPEAPDVTIVIAAHNSASVILNALNSALSQTLANLEVIVVDDCSSDQTRDIVETRLESDPRLRLLSTPATSGSAGKPRNLGIEAAKGRFVTFLDSDDVLELDACAVLLERATVHDADIVCGGTARTYVGQDKTDLWRPKVYETERTISGIDEWPELIVDTNSTAKLYSLFFLKKQAVRFPEGAVYEDLVFTAETFLRADTICVTPEPIYEWRIYPADKRQSVTSSLADGVNLAARLDALDRVDHLLAALGSRQVLVRIQRKFLEHDAWIYLRDACRRRNYRDLNQVASTLVPRLLTVPQAVYEQLPTLRRLSYGCLLSDNLLGLMQTSVVGRGFFGLPGYVADGEARWSPAPDGMFEVSPDFHVEGLTQDARALGKNLLQLSSSDYHDLNRAGPPPFVGVTSVKRRGLTLTLTGSVHALSQVDDLNSARLFVKGLSHPFEVTLTAAIKLKPTPWGHTWRASFPMPTLANAWPGKRRIRISIPVKAMPATTPLVVSDAIVRKASPDGSVAAFHSRVRRRSFRLTTTDTYDLVLSVRASSPWPQVLLRRARRRLGTHKRVG